MAKQVHIRVDDTTYEELNEYSALSGQSMQDYLSVAIRQLLVKKREDVFITLLNEEMSKVTAAGEAFLDLVNNYENVNDKIIP